VFLATLRAWREEAKRKKSIGSLFVSNFTEEEQVDEAPTSPQMHRVGPRAQCAVVKRLSGRCDQGVGDEDG